MSSEIYKRIMIATDGSENNRKAITYGIELAGLSGARVFIVYVVDTASFTSIPMDGGWEMMYELLEKEGNRVTSEVIDMIGSDDLDIEPKVLEGHPSNEIIEFAENNDIDLIVMGTHGKSGFDRFLMGSVAENVTRNSRVPVMVVRGSSTKEK
jgi:nucleotide-binding universal stress UspA family protein